MQTEIEAKWLNIEAEQIRRKLKSIGAELVYPERMMKRQNFDFPDGNLEKRGGWVRVRDEGDKITLSYKQLNNRTLHGTKEVSVTVSSFEDTCLLLLSVGFESKSYQETKRESWKYKDTEIEIDTWPWIPTFVEIESVSENDLYTIADKLGLETSEALHGSVEVAYQAEYEVTEAEIDSWKEITFTSVPNWLEERRR